MGRVRDNVFLQNLKKEMALGNKLARKCFPGHIPAYFLKHLWCRPSFVILQASYWTISCRKSIYEKVVNVCSKSILKPKNRESCFKYHSLALSAFITKEPLLTVLDKNVWPSSICHHRKQAYSIAQDAQLALPVFLYSEKYLDNTAVVDTHGGFTYADILHHSMSLAVEILQLYDATKEMKLNGERIALLTDRNATYAIGLFATWICNGISVPLCELHPATEWEYFLKDAQCSLLLVTDTLMEKITPVVQNLGIKMKVISRQNFGEYEKNRWFQADHASNPRQVRKVFEQRKQRWFDRADEHVLKKPAFILYTSGTTGKPKGVVLTHGNMTTMVSGLIRAWGWTSSDVILHVLPLHHLHGIANILLTSLSCGATCVIEPQFDAQRVWHLLTSPVLQHFNRCINLFMAVPTVYAKLIQYFDEHIAKTKASTAAEFIHRSTSTKIRLMVCGSSALPQPIKDRWMELTGHDLLNRYGMTETGMILSNPLHGPRVSESVGTPLPNIEVRITKPNVYSFRGYDIIAEGNSRHTVVTDGEKDEHGDLLVRGPSVFKEYWNKPEATAETFTKDGWFKTGDTVKFSNCAYYIVGRTSVDVIKSGGYKISALHIEHKLLEHPDIVDCVVVGVADITWGQKVAAVIVLKPNTTLELQELREWSKSYLPPYQIPTIVTYVDSIPCNVLGKVNKKEIVNLFFPETANKKW